MKKIFAGAAILTSLMLSLNASAAEEVVSVDNPLSIRPYVSFKAGAAFMNLDTRCNSGRDNSLNNVSCEHVDTGEAHKTVFNIRPAIGLEFYKGGDWGVRTEVEWFSASKAKLRNNHFAWGPFEKTDEEGKTETVYYQGRLHDDIRAQALMFNTYIDYHANDIFTPYAGVGLGWSKMRTKSGAYLVYEDGSELLIEDGGNKTTNKLAVDASLGTAINFNKHLALDVGVSYYYLGTAQNTTVPWRHSLSTTTLDAGLRVSF